MIPLAKFFLKIDNVEFRNSTINAPWGGVVLWNLVGFGCSFFFRQILSSKSFRGKKKDHTTELSSESRGTKALRTS